MQRKNCGYIRESASLIRSRRLVRACKTNEYAHSNTASLRNEPQQTDDDLRADTNERIRASACSSSVRATVTNFVPC